MFWWQFLRLVLSVALEGLYNAACALIFPFRRQRERERIRSLMCRKIGVLILSGSMLSGGFLSGCTHPGTSFAKHVDEFTWSTTVILEQPHWADELTKDTVTLLDPDLGEFKSSLFMLGW